MSLLPNFKWAERSDKVYVTVDVVDCEEPELNVTEKAIHFKGKDGSGKTYELNVEFFKEIKPEDSKKAVTKRNVVFVLEKAEEGFWERLLPSGVKMRNCHVDWDKWVDEDEDTGAAPDMSGMDLSSMMGGGGGGPPGMGGMPPGMMGGMGGGAGGPGGMDMASMMAGMGGGAGGPGGMDMASMMAGMGGGAGGPGGMPGGMDMEALMAQMKGQPGLGDDGDDDDSDDGDMPPLEDES